MGILNKILRALGFESDEDRQIKTADDGSNMESSSKTEIHKHHKQAKSEHVLRSPAQRDLSGLSVCELERLLQNLFDTQQGNTKPWIKLGIDLGTSNSKVVWRGEGTARPVGFVNKPSSLDDYFVPSVGSIHDSQILVGHEVENDGNLSNFKMCLGCVSDSASSCKPNTCGLNGGWENVKLPESLSNLEVNFINAVFLAKLIATARIKILKELRKDFWNEPMPKWTANLGVPERLVEDSPVAIEFRLTMRTAWYLANLFEKYTEERRIPILANCFLAARSLAEKSMAVLAEDADFGCSIYPEVGAQVASIVMSKTSPEGFYAFVDIGGGTVDASLFNYFRDNGQTNRPPFASEVSRSLGAATIEKRAAQKCRKSEAWLKEVKEAYDGMTAEERRRVEVEASHLTCVAEELGDATKSFLEQKIFKRTRDDKYPNIVNETIHLIIGGGGANLKTYQDAAMEAFTTYLSEGDRAPILIGLDKPADFEMIENLEPHFHRFAVAYGLSFRIDELPEHVLCRDVEMVAQPRRQERPANPMLNEG